VSIRVGHIIPSFKGNDKFLATVQMPTPSVRVERAGEMKDATACAAPEAPGGPRC
jgi:hypothetical protein